MIMMMIMIMITMMMANRAVCYHPDLEYSLVSSQGSLYIVASAILAQQDAGNSSVSCTSLIQHST